MHYYQRKFNGTPLTPPTRESKTPVFRRSSITIANSKLS
jgi:hypothetical protein